MQGIDQRTLVERAVGQDQVRVDQFRRTRTGRPVENEARHYDAPFAVGQHHMLDAAALPGARVTALAYQRAKLEVLHRVDEQDGRGIRGAADQHIGLAGKMQRISQLRLVLGCNFTVHDIADLFGAASTPFDHFLFVGRTVPVRFVGKVAQQTLFPHAVVATAIVTHIDQQGVAFPKHDGHFR